MRINIRRKLIIAAILLLAVPGLCACEVKSPKQLTRQAKVQYGPATVVSKYSANDHSEVVLRDKEQGFEYTISSGLYDASIDGTSFGKWENTHCDFDERLIEYCLSQSRAELDSLCAPYNATWQGNRGGYIDELVYVTVENSSDAKPLSEACAKVLQKVNKKKRLDNARVCVKDKNDNYLGSANVKTAIYKDKDTEKADRMLEFAKEYDEGATFVKTERKTLKDTGLDVNEVVYSTDYEYATDLSFPVTYYYFSDSSGRQFFVADIFIYNAKSSKANGIELYNNY